MTSSSNWSNLPSEISSLIFLNLFKLIDDDEEFDMYADVVFDNGRAIDQCALTCQSWRVVAQTIRFLRVSISTEKKLKNIVNVSLPTRELVKIVEYDVLGAIKGKHDDNLKLIATSFPFLEQLEFYPVDTIFLAISDSITEEKLSYLKEITAPTNKYQAKLYASSILALKDRVNDVTIFSKYSKQCGSILYDELLCNIYQFSKLNRLEISTSFNQHDNIVNFVESKIGNLDIETMYLNIGSLNQKTPQVPDEVDEDKIRPSRNLKKLFLTCTKEAHCNDDKSLLFIMKKYPNVENIRFRNKIKAFGSKPYSIPSVSVGVQFLTYLYKMPRYLITNFITDHNTGEILSQMYEKFDKTTKSKFRNVLSIFYVEENEANSQGNNTSMVIGNATKNGVIFRRAQIDFKIRDGEEDQPYYDVIEKAGKYVHEMTITEDVFYTKRSLLHCIIKNCVRLERLNLYSMYATLFFLKPENTSVDIIDDIRHGLKHLHMGSGILYGDKFLRISACFPLLEVLEMQYSNPIDQSIKNYLPMVMPDLSLKHLVITKAGKYHVDLNKFFFQLTTTENSQVIYFSVKILPPDDGYNRPKDPEDDGKEGYRVAKITSAEYETSKKKSPLIAISIQCQALDELVVKYETSFFQVNHVHCLAELSKAK